jgi:hypothetical protein
MADPGSIIGALGSLVGVVLGGWKALDVIAKRRNEAARQSGQLTLDVARQSDEAEIAARTVILEQIANRDQRIAALEQRVAEVEGHLREEMRARAHAEATVARLEAASDALVREMRALVVRSERLTEEKETLIKHNAVLIRQLQRAHETIDAARASGAKIVDPDRTNRLKALKP